MKLLAIDHNGIWMFHRHSEYLQKHATWDEWEVENKELGSTREAAHSFCFSGEKATLLKGTPISYSGTLVISSQSSWRKP